MLDKEFEYLMTNAQEGILLSELMGFLQQLEKAGFIFSFSRIENKIILKQEKPRLIQKIKRFFSKSKKKRLKLNDEQKFVFKRIIKDKQELEKRKKEYYAKKLHPSWVQRALETRIVG